MNELRFFKKQVYKVYKQLGLGWQIAKQLIGYNPKIIFILNPESYCIL